MEDIRVLIFLHLVVSLLITFTGLRLFGYRGNSKKIILVGLIYGLIVWLVRGIYLLNDIPFGTHTLLLGIILIILIKSLIGVDWGTAVGSMLISFSLVVLGSAFADIIARQMILKAEDIFSNVWVHVSIGYIENVFVILMLLVNKFTKFSLVNVLNVNEQQ